MDLEVQVRRPALRVAGVADVAEDGADLDALSDVDPFDALEEMREVVRRPVLPANPDGDAPRAALLRRETTPRSGERIGVPKSAKMSSPWCRCGFGVYRGLSQSSE